MIRCIASGLATRIARAAWVAAAVAAFVGGTPADAWAQG
jgi:hypothetical protein